MGNMKYNPCPHQGSIEKEYNNEVILQKIYKNQAKQHSLSIEGPSQIYKKSLRKDLDTAELAEQVMLDWKLDKCFKEDIDSIIMTQTTQDSIFKREVSVYLPKNIPKTKNKIKSKPIK